MKTWVRRSLNAGALTAGALLATSTAAHADTTLVSSDNTGILNGTQVYAPIQVPIDICGNAVALLGKADAGCEGGATALNTEWGWSHYQASTDNTGILNGTQIAAPIQIPINVCGNAVAVLGKALAGCEGGSHAVLGGHGRSKGHDCGCGGHHYGESATTEGLPLVGGLPVVGPLTDGLLGGGGLPLIGGGLPLVGGLPVVGPLLDGVTGSLGGPGGSPLDALTGSDLIASSPLATVTGLASTGLDTESSRIESDGGPSAPTPVNGGTGGGTGHPKPHPKPRPDCDDRRGGHDVTMISSGNTGILNGTQVYAPIQIPVEVSGVAVGVLGTATAWSHGGANALLG